MEPIELIRVFAKAMKCEPVFDEDFEYKYDVTYDQRDEAFRVVYRDNGEPFDDRGDLYLALRDLIDCL